MSEQSTTAAAVDRHWNIIIIDGEVQYKYFGETFNRSRIKGVMYLSLIHI